MNAVPIKLLIQIIVAKCVRWLMNEWYGMPNSSIVCMQIICFLWENVCDSNHSDKW